MTGKFITFEGNEGTGKSTQLQMVHYRLQLRGIPHIVLREPGGTPVGEAFRSVLKNGDIKPIHPLAELLGMSASRAQLVHQIIKPALEQNQVVLCDRFADSTRAYQGYGRGINHATIEAAIQLATAGLEPDLTLVYYVDPTTAAKRTAQRTLTQLLPTNDRFDQETAAFAQRVNHGYHQLPQDHPHRKFAFINANKDEDTIFSITWRHIEPVLTQTPTKTN